VESVVDVMSRLQNDVNKFKSYTLATLEMENDLGKRGGGEERKRCLFF